MTMRRITRPAATSSSPTPSSASSSRLEAWTSAAFEVRVGAARASTTTCGIPELREPEGRRQPRRPGPDNQDLGLFQLFVHGLASCILGVIATERSPRSTIKSGGGQECETGEAPGAT